MKPKINPQTEQNKKRIQEYRRRMTLWVMAYGISHRTLELFYFDSNVLKYPENKTYEPLSY